MKWDKWTLLWAINKECNIALDECELYCWKNGPKPMFYGKFTSIFLSVFLSFYYIQFVRSTLQFNVKVSLCHVKSISVFSTREKKIICCKYEFSILFSLIPSFFVFFSIFCCLPHFALYNSERCLEWRHTLCKVSFKNATISKS